MDRLTCGDGGGNEGGSEEEGSRVGEQRLFGGGPDALVDTASRTQSRQWELNPESVLAEWKAVEGAEAGVVPLAVQVKALLLQFPQDELGWSKKGR